MSPLTVSGLTTSSVNIYVILDGPPYLWNYSEKALTFYYIAEENIQEVF